MFTRSLILLGTLGSSAYVPTAMEWLALKMQANYGTQDCVGRSPPCVDITFAPGANALGIIMVYTKDKSELATVSYSRIEQLRRLALAMANGMGYPPPEIFSGTVDEFLQQPAQRQLHLPNNTIEPTR